MSLAALDDLVTREVIVTAGKDREDRHILVVNACRFPDPADSNYEDFLEYGIKIFIMLCLVPCLNGWMSLWSGNM